MSTDDLLRELRDALSEALAALRTGQLMRVSQREYFGRKNREALVAAKTYEQNFDSRAAAALQNGERTLTRSRGNEF